VRESFREVVAAPYNRSFGVHILLRRGFADPISMGEPFVETHNAPVLVPVVFRRVGMCQ
jgi:hypothetical protein